MRHRLLPLWALAGASLAACGAAPAPARPVERARIEAKAADDATASAEEPGPTGARLTHTLYALGGKGPPVLLVHGWDGYAKNMVDIGKALVTGSYAVYSVDIRPSDASVPDTAIEMAAAIGEVLGREGKPKLSIVGHSMGGLDARYYLGQLFGKRKVEALVTIATPHHGTLNGYIAHGPAGADLIPGSPLIRLLDGLGPPSVRTLSLYSRTDQVVVPQESAILAGAVHREYWGISHDGMLHDPRVIAEALAFLGAD